MVKNAVKRILPILLAVMMFLSVIPMGIFSVSANSVTPVEGITVTDTLNNVSVSGTGVKATTAGGFSSQKTNVITVQNTSGTAGLLEFSYSASGHGSFTSWDGSSTTSGNYSQTLTADASITFSITGKKALFGGTGTLTLSNMVFTPASGSSPVTFNFDSTLGSVTAGGEAINAGDIIDVTPDGVALVATPNSGVTFEGWYDVTNDAFIETDKAFTYVTTAAVTLEAVFVGQSTTAQFKNGGAYYTDLSAAIAAASSGSDKVIVVTRSGIVPAGDYTIPSGVTLLVPRAVDAKVYTEDPYQYAAANYVKPSAYKTLTLAPNANITVNGAISVAGGEKSGNTNRGSMACGPYGEIKLSAGSNITVNAGGFLYAWGFITGSGDVLAKNDATVYELFQLTDFRGGTQTTGMKNKVFPFNQYYVQNIESRLTLEAGATEYSHATVTMSVVGEVGTSMAFISDSGAMFNLTSGSVTKYYDGATDRLIVESNGDMSISPITITISIYSIKTKEYTLPINSNISVNANSGTITVNQDVCFLPGSELIVGKDAVCKIGSGINAYVYDADQWDIFCYNKKSFKPIDYAPGRTYTRTEADLVDAKIIINGTVDASLGGLYTTIGGAEVLGGEGGKIITSKNANTTTYQLRQDLDEYTAITATPIKVNNADGSGFVSVDNTYVYTDGRWVCETHKYTDVVTPPTCTSEGFTTHTCVCGESYVDSYTAAGHDYASVVTAPTCTSQGFTTFTCNLCGDSFVDNYVDALAHSYGEWIIDADATCEGEGSKHKECSVCGDTVTEAIAAKGHSFTAEFTVDKAAGDLYEGSKSRHCANCDAVTDVTAIPAKTDFIATLGDNGYTVAGYKSSIDGKLVIPESLDGVSVVAIAENAFEGQGGMVIVQIPVTVTAIAESAFAGCSALNAVNYDGTMDELKNIGFAPENEIRVNYLDEIIGDLDEDGSVTATDMTFIVGVILESNPLNELQSYIYDTNADGMVNLIDLVRLKKYLAGKMSYLGHETALATYGVEEVISTAAVNSMATAAVATASSIEEDEVYIADYETFISYLPALEMVAYAYMYEMDPTADPIDLIIKYVRTGVDRYNSGSWGIMAGYENADFAAFARMVELDEEMGMPPISALKNLKNFQLPSGEWTDMGHVFGTMDITYHNKGSQNHADVGGWTGDIVDLITRAEKLNVEANLSGKTFEEKVTYVKENLLLDAEAHGIDALESFSATDMIGDLDAIALMDAITSRELNSDFLENFTSDFTMIFAEYFTPELNMVARAEYFIDNRMDGITLRTTLRDAVYNAYISNNAIATLEGTRGLDKNLLAEYRKICCYVFADYICELAGDWVEDVENPYYEVFSSSSSVLAPGITQEIKYATSADNKQMVYYLATGDLTRDDVKLQANYKDNDPTLGWGMQPVLDQANAAQNNYGNPESDKYIDNYNVIVATNGGGFNMVTGNPSGLLVMNGVEYNTIGSYGFVGVLKDGTPVIGTAAEYKSTYKGKIQEGIEYFGATLIKDGKIVSGISNSGRASRTAIGFTKTGKVVMMVLDGRQEPFSCGGTMAEIAQILLDAGCVVAVNLDGGGSTTFVARPEGGEELEIINRPSDGYARSVGASLVLASTAPSSTAFDHAVIESDYLYATPNSSVNLIASGVSATGNAAELPEGTYWAVSDETVATVDAETGILTAKNYGEVTVYLMLDGQSIASKIINIISPDRISFSRDSMNAVYGTTVELPIKATFMAKPVAFNVNDIVLSMNTPAGSFSGLTFIGDEASGQNFVTITVSLASAPDVSDTMSISLFAQGEAAFDFDKATGGDKEIAWDREVTNSTTSDSLNYFAISSAEDMITSYVFAIDMSKISIPSKLQDIVYILPGAASGATAWEFLCQLAERISPLTTVTATIAFDQRFDVDYSGIKFANDYFTITGTNFNTNTNVLTVTLSWKDQTEPIDPTIANPIGIISGIKLTPKADAYDANGTLVAVNSGEISYNIFMRASALYTFANDPENQEQFNLFPYVNPDDANDRGGSFASTYKTFEDKYTLVSALKNGWESTADGFVYYVEGEKLTGIQFVEGFYYDFGEVGYNVGQTKFTGFFFDDASACYRYAKAGVAQTGWVNIGEDWYYFDSAAKAVNGKQKIDKVTYTFDNTGKLTAGVWVNMFTGWRYYYGPTYYNRYWYQIDGEWYFFKDGLRLTGYQYVGDMQNVHGSKSWYYFDENGVSQGLVDGIFDANGILTYAENGKAIEKGLFFYDGAYYFAKANGKLAVNESYYAWLIADGCDLPKGHYDFGPDGKVLGLEKFQEGGSIIEKDGKLYYYENGNPVEKGLFFFEGEHYFARYDGSLITNQSYYAWFTDASSKLPKGSYEFGPDGKLLQGIVEKNGVLYFYENGNPAEKGLFVYEGDYYFSRYDGSLIAGQSYYAWKHDATSNLPNGHYEFGADGKMLQGIVNKDGVLYYYENGNPKEMGLFFFDGAYYFSRYNGALIVGQTYYAWKHHESSKLPNGHYEFDENGRMVQGIVERNGVLYFYENGNPIEKGLFMWNGDYYYSRYDGSLVVGQSYYAWKHDATSNLPNGHYEFGADGKMVQGIVERNGVLYFYENGNPIEKGLFMYNGDYYYTRYDGSLIVGQTYYAWKHDATSNLPNGTYEFGADGKMLQGIINVNGTLYFYENGVRVEKGLFLYNGDYYYAAAGGKLIVSQQYYAWKVDSSSAIDKGNYEFDENGKMINGIVLRDGVYYYYLNGARAPEGLYYVDGYYYYARYNGSLVTNTTYYVWKGNDLLFEQHYTFNELGQIIG